MCMDEVDEITQKLMLEYLQKNHPIKKLRDGRRFKRGILTDDEIKIFLKPREETNKVFNYLATELFEVFGVQQLEINMAVLKYLNLI